MEKREEEIRLGLIEIICSLVPGGGPEEGIEWFKNISTDALITLIKSRIKTA